jgi:lysyl-tRNA synthetase class I
MEQLTSPSQLAAYLYLRMGDPMPPPVLDDQGEIDSRADNAVIESWALKQDPTIESLADQMPRLEQFIRYTGELLTELETLVLEPSDAAPQYMSLFYDAAKLTFDNDRTQLRIYFMWLYYVLYGRPDGSRWGDMVDVLGVPAFTARVRERFNSI